MEHGCRKGSPNASQNDQPRTGTQKKSLGFVGALAASVTLQLTQAREGKGHEPASNAFDETPIQVLEKRNDKVQGKTQLQKNPHARRTLAWAAWIIAKLGGWDGYPSSKPAGPITLRNGLEYFQAIARGWALRDVCIP